MSEKYIRNFESFQVGHWYIYTGNERKSSWHPNGHMDYVLDHKPVQCIDKGSDVLSASFDRGDRIYTELGNLGFDDWIEIKDPSKEYRLQEGEKCYNSGFNTIETVMFNGLNCSGDLWYYYALIDSKTIKDDEQEELSGFKYEEMSFEEQEKKFIKGLVYRSPYYDKSFENYVYFGNDIMFIKKNKFVRL